MFADVGILLPFPPELAEPANRHHLLSLSLKYEELFDSFSTEFFADSFQMGNLLRTTSVSEYDLGGEGDLFKAPEPIIEEPPMLALDQMSAAISIMSGDNAISETIKVSGVDPIQEEDPLLSDLFYECKQDLLEKSAIEMEYCEPSDVKALTVQSEEPPGDKTRLVSEWLIPKSVSTGCLNAMDWINGCMVLRPSFLDFQGLDFDTAFGMRRSFSEADIQTLGNDSSNLGNPSAINSSFEQQSTIVDIKAEDRRQSLLRYRKKKSMRNFGRKIKYACRKALADSQPRVRGRFAKTEECEISKSRY